MRTHRFLPTALAALALFSAGAVAALADPNTPVTVTSPEPASPPQPQASPTSAPPSQGPRGIDPCALLAQPDVASALGVGIDQLGAPTRPTTSECLWAATSHDSGPARQVLLAVDVAQAAKSGCKGLQCFWIVQTVAGYIPGMSNFNRAVGTAEDVEYITGLGDKAAWKNGWLTVLKQAVVFRLDVSAAPSSSALGVSEDLARTVLTHL